MQERSRVAGLVLCALVAGGLVGSNAAGAARRIASGCANSGDGLPSAQPINDPPPASVTAPFAVLRRAAGAEDQLPALNSLGAVGSFELSNYYTGAIRQLAVESDGSRFFVIVGFRRVLAFPASCLKNLGPKQRREVEAEIRREQAAAQPPAYCVGSLGQGALPVFDCEDLSALANGFAISRAGQPPRATVVGLIPDGVASVVITYHGFPAISATVANNFFAAPDPTAATYQALEKRSQGILSAHSGPPLGRSHFRPSTRRRLARVMAQLQLIERPVSVEWHGAGGQLIKRFSPPPSPETSSSTIVIG